MPATGLITDYLRKRKAYYAQRKATGLRRNRPMLAGLSMPRQRVRRGLRIYRRKQMLGKPAPMGYRLGQSAWRRRRGYRRYRTKRRGYNKRRSTFRRRIRKYRFGMLGKRHTVLKRTEQVNLTLNVGEGVVVGGKTVYEYPIFRDRPLMTVPGTPGGDTREWMPSFVECGSAYKSTIFDCYRQWKFNGIKVTYSDFKFTRIDNVGIKEASEADDLPEFQITELPGMRINYLWDTENHFIPPDGQTGPVYFEKSGIKGDYNKIYKRKYIKANSPKPSFKYYYKARYRNGHTMGGYNRFLDSAGGPEFTVMYKKYFNNFQQFCTDVGIIDEMGVITADGPAAGRRYRSDPSLLIATELDMNRLFAKTAGEWGMIGSRLQVKYNINYKSYWSLKDPVNYPLDQNS